MKKFCISKLHNRLDAVPVTSNIFNQQRIGCSDGRAWPGLTPDSRPIDSLFLGDLIDRGPQSAQVVDLSSQVLHCLLGNHEQMLLKS